MKYIPLTRGYEAIVDDEDYAHLMQWKWTLQARPDGSPGYAIRRVEKEKKQKTLWMHRVILGTEKNVDHIDSNGLNNQRSNLRLCNQHQNSANARKLKKKSSKYKGVSWDTARSKWGAKIMVHRRTINLGRFLKEKEAAEVYNEAAKKYFGEFARVNLV